MTSAISVPVPTIALLMPIVRDLGHADPVAVTDIKGGDSKVFRIDLADGTALVLKAYDPFNTAHYVVAGETFASRLLYGLDLPVTRYLTQDETCSRLPYPFAITNYLPGVTVKSLRDEPDIADAYRQMGALLRRLHAVSLPGYGQFGKDGVRDSVATNAEQMRRAFAYAFSKFRENGGEETLARQLEAIVEEQFDRMTWSKGAVFAHDDLNPNNVLVERDATGRLRLTGLIDFGNARAADAVSDLAKNIFNTEHELPGSTPAILEGYGPIDHPDPEGALWFYTLHHRVVMWWWLRHVGFVADGERHPLIDDLKAMAGAGGP
jgi:aminoglycoside phosphotransferase (APT) family kinase protein